MSKRYKENWEVPDDLKYRITKVYSNRSPKQEIIINAELFVALFRDRLNECLPDYCMNKSSNKQQTKSNSKNSDKKEREQRISALIKYSNFTRPQAEVAIAIELGEINGDVIEIDENN